MAQIQAGKAIAVNGSVTVTCTDPSVNWATAISGSLFGVYLSNIWYTVVAATAPLVPGVNPWTLTLASPFQETSTGNGGSQYVIAVDFTPNHNLPIPNARDSKINSLMARAMNRLDQVLAQLFDISGSNGVDAYLPDIHTFADFIALPAAALPDNAYRFFIDTTGARAAKRGFVLFLGDDATDLDSGIGRPSDYAANTNNARVWREVE